MIVLSYFSLICIIVHIELWCLVCCIITCFQNAKARDCYSKMNCICIILDYLNSVEISILCVASKHFKNVCKIWIQQLAQTCPISIWFQHFWKQHTYGTPVALALCKSPWPILDSFSIPDDFTVDNMPWLTAELSPWMSRLPCKLLIGRLKLCLQSMQPSMRPLSKNNSVGTQLHAIWNRGDVSPSVRMTNTCSNSFYLPIRLIL